MMGRNYLLVKRGLYWRPNSAGYTGLKDEAGRYTLDECAVRFPNVDSTKQDTTYYISEDDAPEYAPNCCNSIKTDHMLRKSQSIQVELQRWKDMADELSVLLAEFKDCECGRGCCAECVNFKDADDAIAKHAKMKGG